MSERRRLAAVVLAAVVWAATASGESPSAADTYAAECAFCHGAKGGGDGQGAAMLTPRPTAFADPAYWKAADRAALAEIIRRGKPNTAMMAYSGRLTEAQIDALLAYLETLAR